MKYLEILNRHQKTISKIGIAITFLGIILWLTAMKTKEDLATIHIICPYFILYSIFGYLYTKKEGPNYIKQISIIGCGLLPILYFFATIIDDDHDYTRGLVKYFVLYATIYSIIGLYWLDKEKYQFKSFFK